MNEGERTAHTLRAAFLWLAAASAVGTAIELATIRHWRSFEQVVPWMVLAVLALGIGIVALRPSRSNVIVVRVLAAMAMAGGLFGIVEHIRANYGSAVLDYRYTERWPTMSVMSKLWAASSGAMGPSPILAPGILLMCAACLCLATLQRSVSSTTS